MGSGTEGREGFENTNPLQDHITDAYTEELRVVLSDGSLVHTREVVLDSEEWDEIAERYPDLKRNVSGYNLDRAVYENDAGERCINLSKLVVGSEGSLGVVVEATVGLVSQPAETALAVYFYDDLIDALAAVPDRPPEHLRRILFAFDRGSAS